MTDYDAVKDSGEREEWDTGSRRDTQVGKGRYDLIPPYFLKRLAVHLENGARKYGDKNWELGQPLSRYLNSGIRHSYNILDLQVDEDHPAAVAWNLMAFMCTAEWIRRGDLPAELDDLGYVDALRDAEEDAEDIAAAEEARGLGLGEGWENVGHTTDAEWAFSDFEAFKDIYGGFKDAYLQFQTPLTLEIPNLSPETARLLYGQVPESLREDPAPKQVETLFDYADGAPVKVASAIRSAIQENLDRDQRPEIVTSTPWNIGDQIEAFGRYTDNRYLFERRIRDGVYEWWMVEGRSAWGSPVPYRMPEWDDARATAALEGRETMLRDARIV